MAWPWGTDGARTARAPEHCPARPGRPHPGSFGPDPWRCCQAPRLAPSLGLRVLGRAPQRPLAAVGADARGRSVTGGHLQGKKPHHLLFSEARPQPAPAGPPVPTGATCCADPVCQAEPASGCAHGALAGLRPSDGARSAGWGPGQGRESRPAVASWWATRGHSHALQPCCTLAPCPLAGLL